MTPPESVDQILDRARALLKSSCAEALVLAGQARALAAEQSSHSGEAAALNLNARILIMLGRHDAAMLALQQVSDMATRNPIGAHQGEAMQLLGRNHYLCSRYGLARECWRTCLALVPPAINNSLLARANIGLGCLARIGGNHDAALQFHRQAESQAQECDDPVLYSEAQLRVAGDLIRLDQPATAMQILREALPQIKAARNYAQEATAYALIGEIHFGLEEIEKAHASLMLALKINRLLDRPTAEAANLRLLGFCELHRQEYDGAFDFLNTARALALECGSLYLQALIAQALAKASQTVGDHTTAEQYQAEYRHLRGEISQLLPDA